MAISTESLQQACFSLEVFVDGRAVGVLEEQDGRFLFQYYPGVDDSDFVSLLMPVRARPYDSPTPGVLPPVFDMNLPEGSLRRTLVNRYSKVVRGFNDLALLYLVGRNTIGKLSFGAPHQEAAASLRLDEMLSAEDADELLAQMYGSDVVLSGVAGAQPKVIASIDQDDIRKFSEDAAGQEMHSTFIGEDVIVKTGSAETPWLATNEFYCLRAAKLSGLEVPKTRLFTGGQVLAVDRFDRRMDEAGQRIRLGAEDFCSLSAMIAQQKYDSSYERVSKALATFTSPENLRGDRVDFFQSLVLSCVLRNGDAHLKNFTLLHEPTQDGMDVNVWLSPVYDICTTNVYLSKDQLALTLDGSKRYPSLKKLQAFGARFCSLTSAQMREIFDRVEHGVTAAAREMWEYGQKNPDFMIEVGHVMLCLWKAGLQDIGRNLDVPGWNPDAPVERTMKDTTLITQKR